MPADASLGETDQSILLEKAKEVVAAHPKAVPHYYLAGHGFNCDQRGYSTKPRQARARTLEFFRKHIG